MDNDGTQQLHHQSIAAGTENLATPGGSIGYELESGESNAVFAIVRFEQPVSKDTLRQAIPKTTDPGVVCEAVRAVGGRCAAERVEGVQ